MSAGIRKNRKKQKQPAIRILAILVTFMTVILFLTAISTIRHSKSSYRYTYKESDYAYEVKNGDYGALYYTAIRDQNASPSKEIQAYRALAGYYEQAVLTHAYEASGEEEKAARFRARMEEYNAALGSLSAEAANVRAGIGME